MSKKNTQPSTPSVQPATNPPQASPAIPASTPSPLASPAASLKVATSGNSTPPITPDQVQAAKNRLTEGAADRVKRKYTKRGTAGVTSVPGSAVQPIEIPSEMIKTGLQIGFGGVAEWRKCEAYLLNDEKAEKMAILAQGVMKEYFPQIPVKQATLISFIFALGSHVGMAAFMEYQMRQAEKAAALKNESQQSDKENGVSNAF